MENSLETKGWIVFIWFAGVLGDLKATSTEETSEGVNDHWVSVVGVHE